MPHGRSRQRSHILLQHRFGTLEHVTAVEIELLPLAERTQTAQSSHGVLGVVRVLGSTCPIAGQRLVPAPQLLVPALLEIDVEVLLRVAEDTSGCLWLPELVVHTDERLHRVDRISAKLDLLVVQRLRVGLTLLSHLAQDLGADRQAVHVVLHELGQVEQALQDLGRDSGREQRHLEVGDDRVARRVIQLRPAALKGGMKETPGQRIIGLRERLALTQLRRWTLSQQLSTETTHPLHPVLLGAAVRGLAALQQQRHLDLELVAHRSHRAVTRNHGRAALGGGRRAHRCVA
mmetsp:Transcript_13374/g.40380  ORF Transcript_13374/g.40380 Transcript_13374/m.40380 type:complete len:290 (+) Transcript_13374:2962-3831(+)